MSSVYISGKIDADIAKKFIGFVLYDLYILEKGQNVCMYSHCLRQYQIHQG